jgi:hypothetical protein
MANLPPRFTFHKHTPDPLLTVNAPGQPNAITFYSSGVETLRISDTGCWIRGEKVDQDDREAQVVYNSFKEWLTWQQLNRG